MEIKLAQQPVYICSIMLEKKKYHGIGRMCHESGTMDVTIPIYYIPDELLAESFGRFDRRELEYLQFSIPLDGDNYEIVQRVSDEILAIIPSLESCLDPYYSEHHPQPFILKGE